MSRPRKDDELTADNLLSRMTTGVFYQANQLAVKFHLSTAEVRPMLDQMVADGLLVKGNVGTSKHIGFKSAVVRNPESVPKPDTIVDGVLLTVAAPPGPPDLTGVLSGYESQFARRMQLCMLARGAS